MAGSGAGTVTGTWTCGAASVVASHVATALCVPVSGPPAVAVAALRATNPQVFDLVHLFLLGLGAIGTSYRVRVSSFSKGFLLRSGEDEGSLAVDTLQLSIDVRLQRGGVRALDLDQDLDQLEHAQNIPPSVRTGHLERLCKH